MPNATLVPPQLPWWALVTFGSYALGALGLGLASFRECPDAFQELQAVYLPFSIHRVKVDQDAPRRRSQQRKQTCASEAFQSTKQHLAAGLERSKHGRGLMDDFGSLIRHVQHAGNHGQIISLYERAELCEAWRIGAKRASHALEALLRHAEYCADPFGHKRKNADML